jgi:hypothetical protein
MSRRARMRITALMVVLGSLGIGSAAVAVGNGPNGAGHTHRKPCPHTGYEERPCGHGHDKGDDEGHHKGDDKGHEKSDDKSHEESHHNRK